jgi:hypothetical protein
MDVILKKTGLIGHGIKVAIFGARASRRKENLGTFLNLFLEVTYEKNNDDSFNAFMLFSISSSWWKINT